MPYILILSMLTGYEI